MTDTEFRDAVKKGKLSGGYLLFGDEDFLKNRYAADMCKAVAGEEFAEFNIIKLDAAETSPARLEEALAGYPMMAERKAVLLVGFYPELIRERELGEYTEVFGHLDMYPQTVLGVIVPSGAADMGTLPKKPSALYKKLTAALCPVNFERKAPAALKKWIVAKLTAAGAEVMPDVPDALLLRCGKDMYTLSGECDKLAAYALSHGTAVTAEAVAEVCSSYEEEDAFALANAVLAGDRRRALTALKHCRDRREEPVTVAAALGKVLTDMLHVCILQNEGMTKRDIAAELKLHEYKCGLYMQALADMEPARIRAAVERCLAADKLLKSTELKYIALERLICTIPSRKRRAEKK